MLCRSLDLISRSLKLLCRSLDLISRSLESISHFLNILCRSLDLISRSLKILCRSLDFISRSLDLLSRSLNIIMSREREIKLRERLKNKICMSLPGFRIIASYLVDVIFEHTAVKSCRGNAYCLGKPIIAFKTTLHVSNVPL